MTIPSFTPFNVTAKLCPSDYWARFQTICQGRTLFQLTRAQVFLTNQLRVNFKLLSNLASQQSLSKEISTNSHSEIVKYKKFQFDLMCYVICEQFKYWSSISWNSLHEFVMTQSLAISPLSVTRWTMQCVFHYHQSSPT